MKKFAIAVAVVVMAALAAPAFAAAMNPFMDVPASHWAYDAVAQLAARGVISGYPDGTYKGAKPTTRYEMASALARALAKVDMEKASKEDVELLKRLVVEFKDELDALGVKVDKIDARVAVLERDLGGWAISGQLRFDAKFGNSNGFYGDYQDNANGAGGDIENRQMRGRNQFDLNRYQIDLRKYINPTTVFFARLGAGDRAGNGRAPMVWERYYIASYIPAIKSQIMVGHAELEWERDLDLIGDAESFVGRLQGDMIALLGDFGAIKYTIAAARLSDNQGLPAYPREALGNTIMPDNSLQPGMVAGGQYVPYFAPELFEQQAVIGKFDYQPNEKFRAGVLAYYLFSNSDENTLKSAAGAEDKQYDIGTFTLGLYAGYKFNPNVELKGIYYHQKQGDYWRDRMVGGYYGSGEPMGPAAVAAGLYSKATLDEDKAKMWRIMLDVKQDVLKFTSLWLEYGQMDNNFWRAGQNSSYNDMGSNILNRIYMPLNTNTTKFMGLRADQRWNDTWRTFVRYWQADYDTDGYDKAKNWGLGVGYRLNPAVEFELAYDHVDYGSSIYSRGGQNESSDSLVRFRTFVTF